MCANQNCSLLLIFLCRVTKPNLSNWIVVFSLSFESSGSPLPLIMFPSGIMISTSGFCVFAGSHCRNFVFRSGSGSVEMNE